MTPNKTINKALIIDDEPDLCELAEITLSRMGLETATAHTVTDAKSMLNEGDFDLCITDMNLPDGNGIELVEFIQQNYPNLPVAVITAYGNMELAIKALKAGAFDFVSKPVDLQVFRNLITAAINLPQSSSATDQQDHSELRIMGESPRIDELRKKITKLARSQAPVFIKGESGSGKELTAHAIHQQGSRASNAFIPVNCGAIPSELMESEFFGHRKGSFSGATSDKDGLFMAANGGTLFLDEVADLPLQMQVKLLRAIQEKSIRAIGDQHEQAVDVRILSASHKDLAQLVKLGKFREDLYYRINVIELQVPSLRERKEDIPLLANYFLHKLNQKNGIQDNPAFSDAALQALQKYDFPGNIRELENILERALALAENNIIDEDDLHLPEKQASLDDTIFTKDQPPIEAINKQDDLSPLVAQEKAAIEKALKQTRWNKTAAAKLLGLTLRQLRYRLEKLNIE